MMTNNASTSAIAVPMSTNGKMSPTERLEKIIYELMETERSYVQVINVSYGSVLRPTGSLKCFTLDFFLRIWRT